MTSQPSLDDEFSDYLMSLVCRRMSWLTESCGMYGSRLQKSLLQFLRNLIGLWFVLVLLNVLRLQINDFLYKKSIPQITNNRTLIKSNLQITAILISNISTYHNEYLQPQFVITNCYVNANNTLYTMIPFHSDCYIQESNLLT